MPYKDPAAQAAYQAEWMRRRRAEWFDGRVCIDCGTAEDLQLDHIDPEQKIDHRIWSWSAARRTAELVKCVARCKPCHEKKSNTEKMKGDDCRWAVLTSEIVREARSLYVTGQFTWPQLGARYGVKHNTLRRACKDWWRHLEG